MGLLSPSARTQAGYRLYTDEDLLTLQRILALKFLGFSLEQIRVSLVHGPRHLAEVLAQQRALLEEKRARLGEALRALEETEALLATGPCDWEAVARVIQVIRMEQNHDWVNKYLTEEQKQALDELSRSAYSDDALAKLRSRQAAWTEENQLKATADWTEVYAEARRLAAAGADPGGEEAQALARRRQELLSAFTQNDPEIAAGLSRFWKSFRSMPVEDRPFDGSPFDAGPEGNALLEKACAIYLANSPP